MSNLKAKDLLQAKVLGCLDPDEDAEFSKLMNEDRDFPWEDFGRYQNLVSHLPTLLDAEVPDFEVKDNIVRKLLELKEQELAKEVVEETPEISEEEKPPVSNPEDHGATITEEIAETEDDESSDVSTSKKTIMFKEHGVLQNALGDGAGPAMKSTIHPKEKTGMSTPQTPPKKEIDRTNVRSHISKTPAYIKPPEKTESKKGNLTAIILFIIALIVLILVYFKLSSDIQNNKNEIEKLKKQAYSGTAVDNNFKEWNIS